MKRCARELLNEGCGSYILQIWIQYNETMHL